MTVKNRDMRGFWSLIKFSLPEVEISKELKRETFPEPITRFPILLLLTYFISTIMELLTPLCLEWASSEKGETSWINKIVLILVVAFGYLMELQGELYLYSHKIKVVCILSTRIMQRAMKGIHSED